MKYICLFIHFEGDLQGGEKTQCGKRCVGLFVNGDLVEVDEGLRRGPPALEEFLAHTNQPPPLGPPKDPRYIVLL